MNRRFGASCSYPMLSRQPVCCGSCASFQADSCADAGPRGMTQLLHLINSGPHLFPWGSASLVQRTKPGPGTAPVSDLGLPKVLCSLRQAQGLPGPGFSFTKSCSTPFGPTQVLVCSACAAWQPQALESRVMPHPHTRLRAHD